MSLYLEILTETGRHSYVRFVVEKGLVVRFIFFLCSPFCVVGQLRYTNAASSDKIRKEVDLGEVVEKEIIRLLDEVRVSFFFFPFSF
jgi:hypothetical protein